MKVTNIKIVCEAVGVFETIQEQMQSEKKKKRNEENQDQNTNEHDRLKRKSEESKPTTEIVGQWPERQEVKQERFVIETKETQRRQNGPYC